MTEEDPPNKAAGGARTHAETARSLELSGEPAIANPMATAEKLQEDSTRALALENAGDAVKVLNKIMRGHKVAGGQRPTPSVMRAAANDMLHQAHGRPEARDPTVGGGSATGLTIVINQLSTGETRTIAGETSERSRLGRAVDEALEVAAEIQDAETLS